MIDANEKAKKIVDRMMSKDRMSQWMGIEVLDVAPGSCHLRMTVRPEMCNGFDVTHGGITYSLADSALAFASNGHGILAMSIETSISHCKPVFAGDQLRAEARELNLGRSTGLYEVLVHNQNKVLVAHFKGTVFRTGKEWFAEEKTTSGDKK